MTHFHRKIALAVVFATVCASSASAGLLLDLKATNYNPTTGIWTDSSGNGDNATAPAGDLPTLVSGATPNGSSAVQFTSGDLLNLAAALSESPSGNGFTVFAFEESNGDGNSKTIVGGSAGALEYRVGGDGNGEVQEVLRQAQANLGHSGTSLGTTFHLIDVAGDGSGATFRTDGANDGTASGSSFGPISAIGTANSDEFFVGDIAEIQIYSGALSTAQIQPIEAAIEAAYVAPVPEPASIWLLGLGALGGFGLILSRSRNAAAR